MPCRIDDIKICVSEWLDFLAIIIIFTIGIDFNKNT